MRRNCRTTSPPLDGQSTLELGGRSSRTWPTPAAAFRPTGTVAMRDVADLVGPLPEPNVVPAGSRHRGFRLTSLTLLNVLADDVLVTDPPGLSAAVAIPDLDEDAIE